MFELEKFISRVVIKRDKSMFADDIYINSTKLAAINNKSMLVIGGAGSIGSSFIKAMLSFQPKSLTVVDINENALTELTRDLRSTEEVNIPNEYITYPMDYASPMFKRMFRAYGGKLLCA